VTVAAGARLGPYEILAAIGAGGMGEVYKARDTRLDRTVAIKILSASFATDPQFRERFDREARTISQLDHPHICTLYDVGEQDGTSFLVMQYLEGETLEARLKKGTLPLDQALQVAIQIADALATAHKAGIVHRDLKPGNVMLTKAGAKLLDFGLAKTSAPVIGGVGLSMLPTTPPITQQGSILGTFQYMAPEQLEGKDADARTDIFAFGAVVYEMITGKKAFEGKSQASLIGAIMHAQPLPISASQPLTPPVLDHVVTRCLAKDPGERWQTSGDVMRELKWVAALGSQARVSTPVVAQRKSTLRNVHLLWSVVAVLVLTSGTFATLAYLRRPPLDTHVYRSSFVPPSDWSGILASARLALSPDGRRLAFTATDGSGRAMLWVRALDSLAMQPLAGTEGATGPFWSPDSRSIAFVAAGKLKRIDVSGGPPLTLCDGAFAAPGTWNRDGVILFTPAINAPLSRVSAASGTPSPVTALDTKAGEGVHFDPFFLPDGRHFLYAAAIGTPVLSASVFVGSLDSGDRKRLLTSSGNVQYAQGFLIFSRDATLMAQAFDASTLSLKGEAVPLAEQVQFTTGLQAATFSVSETGVLAFQTGGSGTSQLLWFDRTGRPSGALGDRGPYLPEVNLSRSGTRASVATSESGALFGDLWLFDVPRGIRTRFTFGPASVRAPIWSPDGGQVVFSEIRKGSADLYQKASSGAGNESALLEDNFTKLPESWSPDGRFISYYISGPPSLPNRNDVWILPLFGDRKPFPLTQSPFTEYRSQFSPDGRWIAYASNESGRFEVYVVPFTPGPAGGAAAFGTAGGKWQVSTMGGNEPRWSHDGKEIFYIAANKLMAAAVTANGVGFKVDAVRPLFTVRPHVGQGVYDVSQDDQHFLVNTVADQTDIAPLTLVVNWPAALKK
jgi:serine/threonine protein kinase/Tol biopolymer transport system component